MGISSAEERQDFFQNLIIKNIPFESTAEELLEALKVPDSLISSFKLHRGYAFLTLSQAHPISVDVTLKDRKLIIENIKEEWMCACGMNNYDTRSECLSCGVSRFNRGDGDVSDIPTEYIILRNLSPTTSSQDIYTTLDGHEIVNVIVITDKSTRESWCFAFLRFDTVLPATKLLKFYKQSDLVIDNQVVDLDYASLSTFLPGMITGFTSFIKQDIGYSYWDGKAFGSSFPLSDSIPPPPSIQDYLDTITIKVKEKKQTFIGPAITSRQQRQVTNWKSTDIDFTNDSNVDFELKVAVDKLVPSTSAIDQEFSDLVRVACMLCRRGKIGYINDRFTFPS